MNEGNQPSPRSERKAVGVRRTLVDLLEFTAMAERLTDRGRRAYDDDEMVRLAAEAIIHRIGEAVARLPATLTDAHPGVEWRKIRAMRNVVAHDYGRIDHDILWLALVRRVPHLRAYVGELVAAYQASPTDG